MTIKQTGGIFGRNPTFNDVDIDGDLTVAGDLTVQGTTITVDSATAQSIVLGDNDKMTFGAGSDLQIYHDGANSYIYEGGTGSLKIQAVNLNLQSTTGESYIDAVNNGSVYIYYDNAQKLATTAAGVDITGTLTSDGLTVDSGGNTLSSTGNNVQFNRASGSSFIDQIGASGSLLFRTTASQTSRLKIDSNGDIQFFEHTGTTPKFFWDASAESLGIGTSSPSSYWANADDLVVSTSGNTGISVVSGTTSLGYLIFADGTAGGDNTRGGLGYDHSTNSMLFRVNNDTRMTIDSSGNVGIGTISPSSYSSAANNLVVQDTAGEGGITIVSTNTGSSNIFFADTDATAQGQIKYQHSGDYMRFYTAATERLRITSAGDVLVGTTTDSGGRVNITNAGIILRLNTTNTSNTAVQFVYNGSTEVGGITTTTTSTAYNTSSDYRLKTDVQPMTGATDRLKQLNPVNFEWIADGTRVDGFLAHEAQAVVPEAVTGEKDAVDADGNPEYQGIDQSKLVPLLTAALQEALQKIETLEARVAALEA